VTAKEIYDVQVLPGMQRPGILAHGDEWVRLALSVSGLQTWAEERPDDAAKG
jgi:hypothetical protein